MNGYYAGGGEMVQRAGIPIDLRYKTLGVKPAELHKYQYAWKHSEDKINAHFQSPSIPLLGHGRNLLEDSQAI